MTPRFVVFDIGNVLIEWDPRHLYRDIFDGNEDLMEHFLAHVCTQEWNAEQDRGRPWGEAVRALAAEYPDCAELIRAYDERWEEMVPGEIPGTPEILSDLKEHGVPVYSITNFSVDKLALARRRFAFLDLFDGIVVSGAVGLLKPDPAIYHRLLDTFGLTAAEGVFIDDTPANVETARALGLHGLHFSGAAKLRGELAALGLLG